MSDTVHHVEKCCGFCKFLEPLVAGGECRRRSPVRDDEGMPLWPLVDGTRDWCGEFEVSFDALQKAVAANSIWKAFSSCECVNQPPAPATEETDRG